MNDTVPPSRFRLQFLGANATVTGSRHLVTAGNARVLVDCGLFQGYKPLRLRNWADFPVDPASIDAVLLTHAHLDHSGYLPRLVRSGFRGKVWCTEATRSLCNILLPDSGRLLEEESGHANRSGSSKQHHRPNRCTARPMRAPASRTCTASASTTCSSRCRGFARGSACRATSSARRRSRWSSRAAGSPSAATSGAPETR